MGSVVLFFLFPFLFIGMLFSSIPGAITGEDKTVIELPYNKETGLVWECKEDATWFSVVDNEIKGDNQIFTFKGTFVFKGDETDDDIEEVKFNAQNSETITYYGGMDEKVTLFRKVVLYSPDEYGVITYTPEADYPIDGAYWNGHSDNLFKTETKDGKTSFTYVYLSKDDEKTTFTDSMRYEYINEDNIWSKHELITFKVELENGEATITEEKHQYYVNDIWKDYMPGK